ncbi:MAG: hypothetical protein WCQ77_06530, partial [Planctomycetota bacterium]
EVLGISVLHRSPAMNGSSCAVGDEPLDRLAAIAAAFLPLVAMLAGGLAVACGGVLMLRRVAGAIETATGAEAVIAACSAGLLLVVIGDLASRQAMAQGLSRRGTWLAAVLTRLGLFLAVTAVAVPLRLAPLSDALAVIVALAVTAAAIIHGPLTTVAHRKLRPWWPAAPGGGVPAHQSLPPHQGAPVQTASGFVGAQAWTTPMAGSLLQRTERRALADGGEMVRGTVCVVVPAGSRSGSGHVGFCPPLAAYPAVELSTDYDGVEAVLSAAEVLPWGVRIECRLDEPADETIEIPVDIKATTPA